MTGLGVEEAGLFPLVQLLREGEADKGRRTCRSSGHRGGPHTQSGEQCHLCLVLPVWCPLTLPQPGCAGEAWAS